MDSAPNPYAPPRSELHDAPTDAAVPSVEQALARGYDFSVDGVINQAWSRVKGHKGTLVCAAIVYVVAFNLLSVVVAFVLALFSQRLGSPVGVADKFLEGFASLFAGALCAPLMAGLNLIGIRRAAEQPATIHELFAHFGRFASLFATALAVSVLVYLGTLLLLLPGLYLGVAYSLALPLAAERGLSPWQALEASRKAVNRHWFKVFGLYLTLGLYLLLSAIPLGIGLIWTLPMAVIAVGVLYRTVFGVLPPAN